MARINLLPWREELRNQQQKAFFVSVAVAVIVTLGILAIVHLQIEGMKKYQNMRNQMLQREITLLNTKLGEINEIEDKKAQLLAKIELIQTLQESRPQIVHLFDELATTAPEGVYLTEFKQTGRHLLMKGKAKSNARVSAYMRAIEASLWLKSPKLDIIRNEKNKDETDRSSDFVMFALQGKDAPERNEGN